MLLDKQTRFNFWCYPSKPRLIGTHFFLWFSPIDFFFFINFFSIIHNTMHMTSLAVLIIHRIILQCIKHQRCIKVLMKQLGPTFPCDRILGQLSTLQFPPHLFMTTMQNENKSSKWTTMCTAGKEKSPTGRKSLTESSTSPSFWFYMVFPVNWSLVAFTFVDLKLFPKRKDWVWIKVEHLADASRMCFS